MKKTIITSKVMKRFVWVALCIAIFAFSEMGGDIYTIYLNKQQVVHEFVHRQVAVPTISLNQEMANGELRVYYSHCGQIGKERTLALRDEQNKLLKEWRFADITDEHIPMTVNSKEIIDFSATGRSKLNLVYYANLLPEGRALATIVLGKETAKK